MIFRNFFKIIPLLLFVAFALPVSSKAAVNSALRPSDSIANVKLLNDIVSRVTEIQNLDKSNMSSAEKSNLKKELKKMNHEASELGRHRYLSVGVIIIIILLLILIF